MITHKPMRRLLEEQHAFPKRQVYPIRYSSSYPFLSTRPSRVSIPIRLFVGHDLHMPNVQSTRYTIRPSAVGHWLWSWSSFLIDLDRREMSVDSVDKTRRKRGRVAFCSIMAGSVVRWRRDWQSEMVQWVEFPHRYFHRQHSSLEWATMVDLRAL